MLSKAYKLNHKTPSQMSQQPFDHNSTYPVLSFESLSHPVVSDIAGFAIFKPKQVIF